MGTADEWLFRLRGDTQHALSRFQEDCFEAGVHLDVRRVIHNPTLTGPSKYGLTNKQADARAVSTRAYDGARSGEREERIPYRGIRRTIEQAMERSVYTAPHVTHHATVDVSALRETRERLRPVAADRGSSLTYLPLVAKACVATLREFPHLNSSLDEEAGEIVLKGEYNVGVAVGTDAGLMVPVVERVDEKGLL